MTRKVLGFGLLFVALGTGYARGQADVEQSFGAFHASCKTDKMTDERSCDISLNPGPEFFVNNHSLVFIAFFVPEKSDVTTTGFIRRLRVDKNPPLVGDCIAGTSGLCLFKSKKENGAFFKALESGTTLRLEVGSDIFDFPLEDYRKALAAYNEMRKRTAAPASKG